MSSFTSHPALTPHDDTVIAWQQACTQAADALRPQHDRERLAKALALAHEGAITLDDDGALVTSHGARYRIDADGLCHCPDMQNRGVACKHVLALQIHRQATAALTTSTPDATPLATAQVAPRPSADRWAVTEAPSSCCVRLHIGELELMYTMRDVTDAELTSRVQHLTPWVQDLVDQARERQAQLDTLRQQRDAAAAGQAAEPTPLPPVPLVSPPTDLQALIQQAVQQALAAQTAASTDQPAAPRQPSEATPPASQDGWCARHQVAMERRSNAKGTWLSHWLADEERWCRGK
jgi:hypothetical protein